MGGFQFSTFGKPNASIGLSTKMRLRVLSSGTQRRLINNSNSALVLQAPVAINISLQLFVAHVRKLVHALALDALLIYPQHTVASGVSATTVTAR